MFSVYVRGRKRRLWSPGTIVVSVLAHVLLLAGAVSAGVRETGPQAEPVVDIWIDDPAPKPVTPPPAVEPTPPPPAPDAPKPKEGDFAVLREPPTVPPVIPPIRPNDPPVDPEAFSGIGKHEGDIVTDDPEPTPGPPTGNTTPPGDGNAPITWDMAEELPSLLNRSEAERLFRRYYPPLLRESGMTGRTVVTMIIDAEGRVEPGSVSVQETSHPAFAEPAIKVAEKMRFRPAKLNQRPVSVIIAIPIEWRLEN